jgi:hypothetical protein
MHGFALAAGVLVVAFGLAFMLNVLVRSRARELHFGGPHLDEWEQARRHLHRADQWRVTRATRRDRPASRETLADAQLAYVRYLHDAAQRTLGAPRWRRAVMPTIFLVFAGVFVWMAVISTVGPVRIAQSMVAAWLAVIALGQLLTAHRAAQRQAGRMARLETQIQARHARMSPPGS